jgi:5-methylcytosine-specific restriction endonuclease McrA
LCSINHFEFAHKCSVYPYCYLIKDSCLLVAASGFTCSSCRYRITSEEQARKVEVVLYRYERKKQKKHHKFLRSPKWREAAKKILEYDNFTCQICGYKADFSPNRKNSRYKLKVHHIVSDSADDDLTPKNLVTLCTRCHNLLHGPTRADIRITRLIKDDGITRSLQSVTGIGSVDINGLKRFYHMVKKADEGNRRRFKMPMENVMTQLCFICQHINECGFGEIMLHWIESQYGYLEQFESHAKRHAIPIGEIDSEISSNVNVEGFVIKKGAKVEVDTKYGGTELARAVLRDDTGEILLNLWGSQILIVERGDFIRVEDAYIQVYDGETTLNIPKRGKILVLSPSKSK